MRERERERGKEQKEEEMGSQERGKKEEMFVAMIILN